MSNPTMKDIAKLAGVSTATVSRVLNDGYSSPETKKKVQKAIKELNYFSNDIAKSLRTKKTNTIGILVPDLANDFFMQLAKGIEDSIKNSNYNFIITSSGENLEQEEENLHLLIEKRVDAFILALNTNHDTLIERIYRQGNPIILIDRKFEVYRNKVIMVYEDNYSSSKFLTKKLIEDGHKNIGVIAGSLDVSTGRDRLKGYCNAMKEANLKIDDQLIFQGDFTESSGIKAVEYFKTLKSYPTALLSLNNMMTKGAVAEILRKQDQDDITPYTIASYGSIEFQEFISSIKFYTVDQNPYHMGVTVGKLLLEALIEDNYEVKEIMMQNILRF